jgi:hypothetical protein
VVSGSVAAEGNACKHPKNVCSNETSEKCVLAKQQTFTYWMSPPVLASAAAPSRVTSMFASVESLDVTVDITATIPDDEKTGNLAACIDSNSFVCTVTWVSYRIPHHLHSYPLHACARVFYE